MYHPGKVVKVFSGTNKEVRSSDASTQAMLEMWDENVFTFNVDARIAKSIKEGQVVLVDYSVAMPNPVPKHMIVKILQGKTADTTWARYKKFFDKARKSHSQQAVSTPAHMPEYMG